MYGSFLLKQSLRAASDPGRASLPDFYSIGVLTGQTLRLIKHEVDDELSQGNDDQTN